ncbi:hypothetical protein CA12_09520 [Alienimonas californiensis]|uniref:Uncharacterized protein n=2 Tax=Alienimonas californiensis TaxID=2527989 RepID=A0A517P689_9PLAN|nr:hypothetical protein CA12_09520 [Alienimonas californiensis]
MSAFNKQEWKQLIDEWGIPVEVLGTYSVRDTIGKILQYFRENPEALDRLRKERASKSHRASSELMRTLALLLD